jgi:two-component system chemotaxis response regulator CheY
MSKTILVVDDVAFVRKTLSELLTEAGFDVVGEAEDGIQAIDLYKKLKPNLVTMDIVMPELGGIEATRQIVQHDPKAVIVMVSAMDQMSLIMEAIHAGAKDYIQKPFNLADVTRVLNHALAGKSAPRSQNLETGGLQ